jgi:VWFA-related protein
VAFQGEYRAGSTESMRARSFLHWLAESTGGLVFSPQASRELASIYQSILEELGSQYVLGYVSDNPKRDGKYRRLSVEVKRPNVQVRYRPGYTAPLDEPRRR